MADYIGSILSSYAANSLMGSVNSPNYLSSSSAVKSGATMYGSDFATIASDYKALQTKNYDTLSSSYSYLQSVVSPEYATESGTSTDKAEGATSDGQTIELSAGQLATVYGQYATESNLLNILA